MGYSQSQLQDLAATIKATAYDAIIVEISHPDLADVVDRFIAGLSDLGKD